MSNKIIDIIDESKFIYHQNKDIDATRLGITTNKVVEIPNFISADIVPNMIKFFEHSNIEWGDIAFYGSSGKAILTDVETMRQFGLSDNFFSDIKEKYQEAVEKVFGRKVKANTSHAQKWDVGGFASPHSDNSDHDGNPNAFEINKYVGILYLNNDYEGGEFAFFDRELKYKLKKGSCIMFPSNFMYPHEIMPVTSGTRYSIITWFV
jgi:hypothetical protein